MLLKGDLIWHVDSLKNIERSKWPIKLFNVFPGVAENIDAILFDHIQNEYLIFKVILIMSFFIIFFRILLFM